MDSFKFLMSTIWKSSPSCLHDLVNVSLTMIFCCWKTEPNSERLKIFSTDTLNVMNEIIKTYPSFIKFKNLYIVVSSIIINGFDNKADDGSQAAQFAGDVFSDVPSPLQQLKANMLQNVGHNYPTQPQHRADAKRRFTQTDQSPSYFSPVTSSQLQLQPQHFPIKFKDSQSFQQDPVGLQQQQQLQQFTTTQPAQNKDKMQHSQRHSYQYNMPSGNIPDNPSVMDTLTQELFQDVFKQYYFQGNDTVREDIDQLFEFQRFNWT